MAVRPRSYLNSVSRFFLILHRLDHVRVNWLGTFLNKCDYGLILRRIIVDPTTGSDLIHLLGPFRALLQ